MMTFSRLQVFLLILGGACTVRVRAEKFICGGGMFCRWVKPQAQDWETARSECLRSGGSLLSWKHHAYTEEWILSMKMAENKVWTGLRRLNHRFQWLDHNDMNNNPTSPQNWVAGHPAFGKDCVVVNSKKLYESVSCNDSFPTLCTIDKLQKDSLLRNLDLPSGNLQNVSLVAVNGTRPLNATSHVVVNPNDYNLLLRCNVVYNGARPLEYAWIKDGFYLIKNSNQSELTPALVRDDSKQRSEGHYQKQGTYTCQVREFGNPNALTSNAILVTHNHVLNGILISLSDANFTQTDETIAPRIYAIDKEILKKQLSCLKCNITWDPLFTHPISDNIVENRNSIYIDIPFDYPLSVVGHFATAIGSFVESLNANRSALLIGLQWATYCPESKDLLSGRTDSDPQTLLVWHAAWSNHEPAIANDSECVHEDNTARKLHRQCIANFTHGAHLEKLDNGQKCRTVISRKKSQCRSGYKWSTSLRLCYLVTVTKPWEQAIAHCHSDWPTSTSKNQSADNIYSALGKLQTEANVSAIWHPFRKSSIYDPSELQLIFNEFFSSEGRNEISGNRTWNDLLEAEICLQRNLNGTYQEADCLSSQLPAICAYRNPDPADLNETQPAKHANLCPDPWRGYRIHQGVLVCYSLLASRDDMDWNQANELCHRQRFDSKARPTMATFEDPYKGELWELVRPELEQNLTTSAWIGLHRRSDRFCWNNNKPGCSFNYFNWHPSAHGDDGHFGAVRRTGLWELLPKHGKRKQVICEATVDLHVDHALSLAKSSSSGVVHLRLAQQELLVVDTVQRDFNSLSDYLAVDQQHWAPLPFLSLPVKTACFSDGQPWSGTIHYLTKGSAVEIPISHPGAIKTLHCEGWMGWPRRFVRSNIIYNHPPGSFVFLIMLQQYIMPNLTAQILALQSDVRNRTSQLASDYKHMHLTSHRAWSVAQRSEVRLLVRLKVVPRQPADEQQWLFRLRRLLIEQSDGNDDYRVTDVRSTVACPQETLTVDRHDGLETRLNLTWKSVSIGTVEEPDEPCLSADGRPAAQRLCAGNPAVGAYWQSFPNSSEPVTDGFSCRQKSPLLSDLIQKVSEVDSNTIDPCDALGWLSNATSEVRSFTTAEIRETIRLLNVSTWNIDTPSRTDLRRFSETLTKVLGAADQLTQAQSSPGIVNALVGSVEHLLGRVNIFDNEEPAEEEFRTPRMVTLLRADQGTQLGYGAKLASGGTAIGNSCTIFEETPADEYAKKDVVVLLPMKEIRQLVGTEHVTLGFSVFPDGNLFGGRLTTLNGNRRDRGYVVTSPVVLAQVGNQSISNLTRHVQIFFRSSCKSVSATPVCVFWDKFLHQGNGGWSSVGCRYAGKAQHMHLCECNHLTPLAMLIPYFDAESIDCVHQDVLGYISIIGCAISMAGLLVVILTFLLFRKWRKSLGNKILFNLSSALFGLMTSFLSNKAIEDFDSRECRMVAAFTHYFLLASFAWMLVEAIYQYLVYVVVVGAHTHKSRFMRKTMPIAWGMPLIPVLAITFYDATLYRNDLDVCWPHVDAFNAAVVGPVALVFVANTVLFLYIVKCVLCSSLSNNIRSTQSKRTRSWYQFRMVFCIFILLGMTWTFGFLVTIKGAGVVFAYMFCIANALQGFTICVFFVFSEKNTSRLWGNLIRRRRTTTKYRVQRSLGRLYFAPDSQCSAGDTSNKTSQTQYQTIVKPSVCASLNP